MSDLQPGSTPAGSELVTVSYSVRVPALIVQRLVDLIAVEHDHADDEARAEYLDEAICKWVEDRLPTVLTDNAEGRPDVEI